MIKNNFNKLLICLLGAILICVICIFVGCDNNTKPDDDSPELPSTHTHSMHHNDLIQATCTETGNVEYWNCTECNKNFADEEGLTELQSVEIVALGHTIVIDEAIDATCADNGWTSGCHCSVCEVVLVERTKVDALGHNWETVVTQQSTCVIMGSQHDECTRCGITTESEQLPALGHDYGTYRQTKAPTCIESGTEVSSCSRCSSSRSRSVSALGHNWGEWLYNNDATCNYDGTTTSICQRCLTANTQTATGSAKGHLFRGKYYFGFIDDPSAVYDLDPEFEVFVNSPINCIDIGYAAFECETCQQYLLIRVKGSHDYDENGVCNVCGDDNGPTEASALNVDTKLYCIVSKIIATESDIKSINK